MQRDPRLVRLTQEHHKALVLALRIERDLPAATAAEVQAMYEDVLAFWQTALLRHFRAENECLVTRLTRHIPLEDESVARLCRDHIRLDALIVRMLDNPQVGVQREALGEFGTLLRDHVHWEEEVMFERTQQTLTEGEMAALGADLAALLPEQLDFPPERLYPKHQRNPRAFKKRDR